MTATDIDSRGTAAGEHDPTHAHEHPSDRKYVVIALILAVITAAEVGTYFMDEPSTTALVLMLFPMMIAKFLIVVGWFMHLRYDNPLFRRIFAFGLLLAIAVFSVAMAAMQFFADGYAGG